jgi:hypothetical protein
VRTKSNVNPGHYKTAGRERPGDGGVPEKDKATLGRARSRPRAGASSARAKAGGGAAPRRKG